jgi:hypothetical protein
MKRSISVAAITLCACSVVRAHRLDEYLQATLLSIGRTQVEAEMTLTPGVAVFPAVMAAIDADGDGAISPAEQEAYARRAIGDLSVMVDGHAVTPRLGLVRFPEIAGMREGRGEIRIEFAGDLPRGAGRRRVTIENRHLTGISVYQVNALVPPDPEVRIVAQRRNYTQARYDVEFIQPGAPQTKSLGLEAGLLAGWLAIVWGVRKKIV